MAENLTQLTKGLVTDFNKENQPKDTYPFALNAVNETREGDIGYLSNQEGNSECSSLILDGYTDIFYPIGSINLIGNDVLLFLATEDASNSAIVIQSNCGNIQQVIVNSCFSFSIYHQVKGTYRIRKGCNRVIYFVDGFNPDRSIDIDSILNDPTSNPYMESGVFQCNLTKINPNELSPCISYTSTNDSGGNLRLGVYQFAIAIGDTNLNFNSYSGVTPTIPIVDGLLTSNFYKVKGGDPAQQPPTGKSINLRFSNLDLEFSYIKLAVIETISGVSTAYEVITLPISGSILDYTYTGLDYSASTVISIASITTPILKFDTSLTLEQQDNRLLRGNVKDKIIDYAVLQRAACLIQTTYTTKALKYKDTQDSVVSGNYYFDTRSYMRDEIYALGIKAIYTDGTESAVLHIPGRAPDLFPNRNPIPAVTDPFVTALKHNRAQPNSNKWDSCTYLVSNIPAGDNLHIFIEDTKPFNITSGNVPRWLAFNTSLQLTQEAIPVSGEIYSTGVPAYWESTAKYPITLDCTDTSVYSICDPITGDLIEDLSNQGIRHHKMPDTTMEAHYINRSVLTNISDENDFILTLGLQFNLTNFHTYLSNFLDPNQLSQIQGYKIVRALRSTQNKTIVDKGIVYNNMTFIFEDEKYGWQSNMGNMYLRYDKTNSHDPDAMNIFPFSYNTTTTTGITDYVCGNSNEQLGLFIANDWIDLAYDLKGLAVHTPKAKFTRTSLSSYVKFEKEIFGTIHPYGDIDQGGGENERVDSFIDYNNIVSGHLLDNGTPYKNQTNRLITAQQFVDGNDRTKVTIDEQFFNLTQQEEYIVQFEQNLFDVKLNTVGHGGGPACELIFTPVVGSTDGTWTGTDKCSYISLKNYVASMYGQISSIIYEDISTCTIDVDQITTTEFTGDIFISRFAFVRSFLESHERPFPLENTKTLFAEIDTFFVESEVNTALRNLSYISNDVESQYYPYYNSTSDIVALTFTNNGIKNGFTNPTVDEVKDIILDGTYCINQYHYNADYSKELDNNPSFPLAATYNYCDRCLNNFPHRIVYSLKSYSEDLVDNYKVYLVNNYSDLPGNTGEITDIFKKNDNIFIRTWQSLWNLPTKPQSILTNESNIEIGTGDIFSIPAREVVSTKIGYTGGQTRWDSVINEYGATFVDQQAGIVYNYDQSLMEISNNGTRKWFEKNLPSNLLREFPDFIHNDNPASKVGIGLIGYFDPEKRTYFLTKKDYLPLYPATYDALNEQWQLDLGGRREGISNDPYNTPGYFENKSWTISYSFERKMWISWHSFTPNFAFFNRDFYYTSITNNNNIWKHNSGDYQSFYDTIYPHIIELVDNENAADTKVYDSSRYISNTLKYDALLEDFTEIPDKTFDKGIFYNDYQSTGELDITVKNSQDPFSSLIYDPSSIQVENTETTWNFNGMRDMIVQTTPREPIFTTSWTNIQSQYPIDKVPNTNVLNYLKSQFELSRLRDNYLALRLFFSNPENHKIVTKFITTLQSKSFR